MTKPEPKGPGAGLTEKQAAFVQEYLVDLNATQAAIRAGYSEKTAYSIGHENLSKPEIAEAIAAARKEWEQRTAITQDRVLAELAKIGFANMQDYMRAGPAGDPYLDFSQLTRDQAAALSEVTVEDFKDGRGEESRDVRRVKFKLSDKRAALVDIGRHLGMFPNKIEGPGPDGEHVVRTIILAAEHGGGETPT
jgi:phage terminase small subunit